MTKEQIKEIIEMYKLDSFEKMKKENFKQGSKASIEFFTLRTILWLFEDENHAETMYEILLDRRRIEKELEELRRS